MPRDRLVISIPHAGRHYPPETLARARVPRATLERLEDRHVDCLANGPQVAGHVIIRATHARAHIDLNRAETEWTDASVADGTPPAVAGERAHRGLGLVPQRLHGAGTLWRSRLRHDDLIRRIVHIHRPYHRAIATALAEARRRFGSAILIDLHSMPSQPGGTPQFIVGDRHGVSASAQLSDRLLAVAEGHGLSVAHNSPYAGAYGITHHADPKCGIEAVQIEFDRALYLDQHGQPEPHRVARMRRLLGALLHAAADYGAAGHAARTWRDAAE